MRVALLAVAGAVIFAAPAHADTNTDGFLASMAAHNITATQGDAQLLRAGFDVCTQLDRGVAPLMAAYDMFKVSQLSAQDSGFFVGASIAWLCPEHSPAATYVPPARPRVPTTIT